MDTFAESFQLQISVLDQSVYLQGWSLNGWAKYKQEVPDMSDCNENLEITCNSKLKFGELKDFFTKRVPKN